MEISQNSIVVLHGWGHNHTLWKDFEARCAGRKVLILDLPGFGDEKRPNAAWGIPEYAAWVDSKVKEMNLTKVALIGHSFGGRIAAYLASQRPPWLAKLVLYGAPVLIRRSISLKIIIRIAKFLKPLLPRSFARLVNEELAEAEEKGLGAIYRRVVSFDQTVSLPLINVPTLLLWGGNDSSAPVHIAQEAHGLIRGSRITIVPDTGHSLHLENPTLFYGCVTRFIDAS